MTNGDELSLLNSVHHEAKGIEFRVPAATFAEPWNKKYMTHDLTIESDELKSNTAIERTRRRVEEQHGDLTIETTS